VTSPVFATASNSLSSGMGPRKGPRTGDDGDSGTATISKPEVNTSSQTKTPPMYRVILMNDDFTPMEFVIQVLQKFFQKGIDEATRAVSLPMK
jgi:ATP-dependent Clp protease adaptor protein ClpS